MAIIATIWGSRLTWNFNRRGGYKWPLWDGEEDYRWEYVQRWFPNKFLWIVFNFSFVSCYQIFLLMLISTPSLVCWSVAMSPACQESNINTNHSNSFHIFGLDGLATSLILFFIVIESKADNQQYEFQTEKYRRRATKDNSLLVGDFADGFLHSSGLFTIVRKPNYMAEQSIWICYYIFSIAATNQLFNWSMTGWVLLCLLFQGSGWLTENITLSKYPKYKEYMKSVPLYVPSFFSMLKVFFDVSKKKE